MHRSRGGAFVQSARRAGYAAKEGMSMSYSDAEEALCRSHAGTIALLIKPRLADLGEFSDEEGDSTAEWWVLSCFSITWGPPNSRRDRA